MSGLAPYAERLLDDYIYEQVGDAAMRLRDAYDRVSRRPARKSLEDRRLRSQLGEAAESLRRAALAAAGREPEPKSRLPKVLLVVGAAGGAAILVARRRGRGATADYAAPPGPAEQASANGQAEFGGERLPAA